MRNTTTSSGGATCSAPQRQTQVGSYLDELAGAIDLLEKRLDSHADRLAPVIRPLSPERPANCKEALEEPLAPVADRIRNFVRRVSSVSNGLAELTERTEA